MNNRQFDGVEQWSNIKPNTSEDVYTPVKDLSATWSENHFLSQMLLTLFVLILITVITIAIIVAVMVTERQNTTTTTTTTTPTTAALSLSGVQVNLDPASLSSAWSNCSTAPYSTIMDAAAVATVLVACSGNRLLLGCRPVGSTVLTVAAMGNRADVLFDCSNTLSCSHLANGVQWYFSTSFSWGFAQGGDTVNRATCDTGSANNIDRLCWRTDGNGADRCGSTTGLGASSTWERVIYHAS